MDSNWRGHKSTLPGFREKRFKKACTQDFLRLFPYRRGFYEKGENGVILFSHFLHSVWFSRPSLSHHVARKLGRCTPLVERKHILPWLCRDFTESVTLYYKENRVSLRLFLPLWTTYLWWKVFWESLKVAPWHNTLFWIAFGTQLDRQLWLVE